MPDAKKNPALGEFIRAHRERLSPAQAGLPAGQRRRAKGLRREEVAALCDISTTWLTWIEQGRTQSVSATTLSRLASALHLSSAEQAYLFNLAGLKNPETDRQNDSQQAQALLSLATQHIHTPAYVLDTYWQAAAWNEAAAELFALWLGPSSSSCSLLDFVFLDAQARQFIDDWPSRASRLVAELRADLRDPLSDTKIAALIERLSLHSAEFAQYWRQQDVLEREGGSRVFHHPQKGRLEYQQITLRLAQAPEYKLVMLM